MNTTELTVPKAVITRTKDGLGRSLVKVDGVRVGVAQRHSAALGSGPWWTLWVDEPYRASKDFISCPAADVLKELAVDLYSRAKARERSGDKKSVQLSLSVLTYSDMDRVKAAPDADIQELAADIKKKGILRPILVRRLGDLYLVIDGLARWRAAILDGLDSVPAFIEN